MEGELKNLSRVCLSVIASLVYCRSVSSRLPEGKWRFASLFPIFYVFSILPIYTPSTFCTAVNALFFTWIANFRLILFAFGRGPIASPAAATSLPIFVATTVLPFTIKPQNGAAVAGRKSKLLPLYLPTEIPIFAALISIINDYGERLHPQIVLLVYCCLVFLLVEILIELSSLLARAVLGLELEPASDEPYLSTSLREFWGRRWNLTVANLLRNTVYKPVRSVLGGDWAALPAVLATFLVSGLMHELVFLYVTPTRPPSWEMTMFFVVQGVGVVVEFALKMALGDRQWVPWWVAGPLTLGFVVGTSFWLFFPPLMRYEADVRVIEECKFAVEVLKGSIRVLVDCVRTHFLT